MRYEILGPIRVTHEGEQFALSAGKTEVLFATLLVRANQIVPGDQLLGELWGDRPPRRACAGLYVYVSQLRKFLSCVGHTGNAITTRAPGYMLELAADELDLGDFRNGMNAGRRALAEGRAPEAVARLECALALWRGPALGAMDGGPIVNGFKTWLDEARLDCAELLLKARLAQGDADEVVSELHYLISANPLRETLYHLLMLALYRSGRQAEALRVYQQARVQLVEELGLEPSRSLRDLQHAILTEAPKLDLASSSVGA